MNNLAWSVLTNILYLGWTWDQSKAFILANYILQDSASQTDADNQMEANKTGGANIESVASDPPEDRTASWYVQGSPFATQLPAPLAAFPAQPASGDIGKVATLTETGVAWETGGGGGGGYDTIGAFDTTPNAFGLSATGTTLSLSAADSTHPGGVSIGAQTIGGAKAFVGDMTAFSLGSVAGGGIGNAFSSAYAGLWLAAGGITSPVLLTDGAALFVSAPSPSGVLHLRAQNIDTVAISPTVLDATGLGAGGSIKLKSPDGTTYTLTVANGGTLLIT